VLAENQALVEFKQQVVGLRKLQDADFASKVQQALAVRETYRQCNSHSAIDADIRRLQAAGLPQQ
jgi:hypothetical protein